MSLERTEIEAALRGRRMSEAARELGTSRRTLQNRMRYYRMTRRRAGRPRHSLKRRHKIAGVLALAALVAGGYVLTRNA